MRMESTPHIVVLGAGFAGLTFCQSLRDRRARVTLIDRQNHHLFQPLLYQVATAGLSAPEIAQPVRSILRDHPNVAVRMDEVTAVDLVQRRVRLAHASLEYDHLVIALGGVTSYFGHPEWERFAPGLKSIEDALRIRREVLLAFERAENEPNRAEHDRLLTIVVVGGGPTGVELAGAFAELARHVLRRDFRHIDPGEARVILLEGGDRVLAHLASDLSASAQRQLETLGVEVRLRAKVSNISEGLVELADGTRIEAANVIWAAGVSASPLTRLLGVETDRAGRLKVQPDLSLPGHPEVFAIGDLALVMQEDGKPVPGVSPAAIQQAQHVARILDDEMAAPAPGHAPRPAFRYWDKGSMATIGRSAAVAEIGDIRFGGFPAWLAWLFVHLIFLVGFRNKLAVLLQWFYSYCTYRRGARIVTGAETCGGAAPQRAP
ncbi:MAG: NAD(P)/FAD-dependent oxidoreductase [Verrucomicrobiae bacterium]|nr:NAD(P)/FAD-dependent oxidoreductase [Verrucomicrobiae bacterium]